MIVLRLRKCATAYVAATVRAVVGGEYRKSLEIGRDDPTTHGRLDISLDGRRVLGTVRDPWSWYVSLWAYGCAGRGGLHARVTRRSSARSVAASMWHETRQRRRLPSDAFKRARVVRRGGTDWPELYANADDPVAFRAWLARVLDPHYAEFIEPWYGASGMPELVGLLSWRYLSLYERDPEPLLRPGAFGSIEAVQAFDAAQNVCDDIVRTDRIPAELPQVLARAGYVLDEEQDARLAELTSGRSRRNTSEHRPWLDYYDGPSLDLVTRRDRLIVERHGFEVPKPG